VTSGWRRWWSALCGRSLAGVLVAAVAVVAVVGASVQVGRGPVLAPAPELPAIVLVSVVPAASGTTAGAAAAGGRVRGLAGVTRPAARDREASGLARPPSGGGRAPDVVGPAARDRAVLDDALTRLARQGVTHGRIRAHAVVRPDLARVLVETRESSEPCAATARWRSAVPSPPEDRPALVVVVGGTMRATAPFARRAGLTCKAAGATPVILLDRRPVPGLAPAVVLLHEMGHAAGLAHDRSADGAARQPGRDLMAPGATAPTSAAAAAALLTTADVVVTSAEVRALAALLGSGPVRTVGRVSGHGRCRGPPAHPPPRRGGAPAAGARRGR